jgi:hypothetical protein
MKVTDDYQAKFRLWALNQTVVALPAGPIFPKFRSQKFTTHIEMNLWKEALLLQVARDELRRLGKL